MATLRHSISNYILRYMAQRAEVKCPQQHLYKNVLNFIINNAQKVERTQCPSTTE